MDLSKYKVIDRELIRISKKVGTLRYLEASNSQEQKRKFFNNKIRNPIFRYLLPPYNTKLITSDLNKIKCSKDRIGTLYKGAIEKLKIKNEIIENINKKIFVIKKSTILYGKPKNKIVKLANKILKSKGSIINKGNNKILTSTQTREEIEKYLKKLKIKNWIVLERNQHSVSVSPVNKCIKVGRFKKYDSFEIKKLIIHEIKGHVYRALNGNMQPLKIFVSGLPNYISTEEGIATYLEEKYGLLDIQSKKRYALRVMAVDLVYKGADFRECFEKVSEYEEDRDYCWETTYRVFRGGGYLKDHIYLEGYLKVKKFIQNGGNLNDLYIGKVGLEHLPIVEELQKANILIAPKYTP